MSSVPSISPAVLAAAANNLRVARYFQLSAFVVLILDHFLTFGDEVERIWKKKWQFLSYLFFLNRYLSPLMRIIIVVAFNDPDWPKKSCDHFVRFSGGGTMGLVTIAEVVLILRVYGLYCGNKKVLAVLCTSLLGQIIVTAVSLTRTQAEPLPPGLHACILIGKTGDNFFAAFWASTLCTDALIFFFTIFRVAQYRKKEVHTSILDICARDGILYFFVIFFSNLFNTVMYLSAPVGIKAIGASYSQLITATMISRLILNLKGAASDDINSVIIFKRRPGTHQHPISTAEPTDKDIFSSADLGSTIVPTSATSTDKWMEMKDRSPLSSAGTVTVFDIRPGTATREHRQMQPLPFQITPTLGRQKNSTWFD